MAVDQAILDAKRTEFAWLAQEAFDVYMDAFIESGDGDRAWTAVRQDKRYDTWFPGNLTDDGRPRYPEAQYANTVAQYDSVMESVGLGNTFQSRYGEWIAGGVTPAEAESRIRPGYERIVSQSQALKKAYAMYYGIEMTDAALLASFLDPDLGQKILTKQISVGEIGGEAYESGFDVNKAFATRMYEEGELTRSEAEAMFQRAETFVPVMSVLAARHADPDDDFNLEEFVAADLFADPEQQRRMRRLMAQERSSFTGGKQVDYISSQKTGGISGLDEL